MAKIYQILTFITDNAGGGGSEQFFRSYPDDVGETAIKDDMARYANIRLNAMSALYSIQEMRASDVTIFRDSILMDALSGDQLKGKIAGDEGGPDAEEIFTRLLVRLEATNRHRRSFELMGIPGGVLSAQRRYLNPASWRRRFAALKDYWIVQTYIKLRGATSGLPATDQILTYRGSNTDPLYLAFTLAGDRTADYTPNTPIRISRARFTLNVDGNWTVHDSFVDTVTTNTVVELRTRRYPPIWNVNSKLGRVAVIHGNQVGDYLGVTNAIPERGVRRKSGRPFGEERGRQSHQG